MTISSTTSANPTIISFISKFQQLQVQARSTSDIIDWLQENPGLLRGVSKALGHVADETYYEEMAVIYDLSLCPANLDYSDNVPSLDQYMQGYQFYSNWQYRTDPTINLQLIFTSLPEVGLFTINDTPEQPGRPVLKSYYFSPAKWPMIAGRLLDLFYDDSPFEQQPMDRLLDDVFPNSNKKTLCLMMDTGLFEDSDAICDWLLANEQRKSLVHITETLPDDFGPGTQC